MEAPVEAAGTQSKPKFGDIRTFPSGATRDTDQGKIDPEGFLHPLVILRFCEYMHSNRIMKDGSYRDSDNWCRGMPQRECLKSDWRHMLDAWLIMRGYPELAREDLETALCAMIFNCSSMLLSVLQEKHRPAQISQGQGCFIGISGKPKPKHEY